MRPVLCRSVVAIALTAGLLAVAAPAEASSPPCDPAAPVCLQVTDTPDPVSVSSASSTTYFAYTATVTNRGNSTLTHLSVTNTAPSGTTLVAARPSSGTCGPLATVVTCTIGNVAAGAAPVTVTFVLTGPATAGTVTDQVQASWDERANDAPTTDPKQDTTVVTEDTTVGAVAGTAETYVPVGTATEFSTDPTGANVATPAQSQVAQAAIPPQPAALVARLAVTPGPFTCPKKEVCRGGAWVQASVPGGPFDPALRFTLRWDASLVASKQTVRNLSVFYSTTLDGTSPLTIVSRRCSSATPPAFEMPCLFGVAKLSDGDFTAVLIQDHNGYMR